MGHLTGTREWRNSTASVPTTKTLWPTCAARVWPPHLFPHLRPTDPLFISSAWGLPYPVAAYREFMGIRKRVCANEGRRLALIKAQEGTGSGGIWAKKYASFQGHCPKSLESRTSF